MRLRYLSALVFKQCDNNCHKIYVVPTLELRLSIRVFLLSFVKSGTWMKLTGGNNCIAILLLFYSRGEAPSLTVAKAAGG